MPVTATGVDESTVVPSPSWPETLLPQQRTAPSCKRAQEWKAPMSTAVALSAAVAVSCAATSAVGSVQASATTARATKELALLFIVSTFLFTASSSDNATLRSRTVGDVVDP